MTGYQSKKKAARDKLIELAKEGMGMHSPDAPEYIVCEALIEALAQPAQDKLKCQCSMTTKLVGSGCQYCNPEYLDDDDVQPPQRTWVEPTGNEWFEWWRISKVADATEAEIDFADFLIIALAVVAKLKEKNT